MSRYPLIALTTLSLCVASLSCKQGGKEIRVKKGPIGEASAHQEGRYDLSYTTEHTCTEHQGQWDSSGKECYVICLPPNTFDKANSKCIAGVQPGHEAGRYDLKFKTESECKSNNGLWDIEDKECYLICNAPDLFDSARSVCVKAHGDTSDQTTTPDAEHDESNHEH